MDSAHSYEPTKIELEHKARCDRLAALTGLPIHYNRLVGPGVSSETLAKLADIIEAANAVADEAAALIRRVADGDLPDGCTGDLTTTLLTYMRLMP